MIKKPFSKFKSQVYLSANIFVYKLIFRGTLLLAKRKSAKLIQWYLVHANALVSFILLAYHLAIMPEANRYEIKK